jgi:hypothetical protein
MFWSVPFNARHDHNHPPGAVRFSDEKNWCHHIRKPRLFNCIQQAKRKAPVSPLPRRNFVLKLEIIWTGCF